MGNNQILTTSFLGIIGILFFTVFSFNVVYAAEQDSKLTFERSHASIYQGEKITFSGSLKDGLGYALAFERITIWENDGSNGSEQIVNTVTDARGNYRVSVTAQYWDGKGNPVEVYAGYSGNGFNKSVYTKSYTVNVDPPPRSTYTESSNDRTIVSDKTSFLTMDLTKGSQPETFRVYPNLVDLNENKIPHSTILVYVNGVYKGSVSSNMWSHSISCNSGNNFISISTAQFRYGVNTYTGGSDSDSFSCTPKVSESKSSITQSTSQKSVTKSPSAEYKSKAFDAKNYFEKQLDILKAGITTAENSLSGLQFESEDAQKKIDEAWSIRWNALVSLDESKEKFRQGEKYLNNDEFRSSYFAFEEIVTNTRSIGDDLKWISKAIEDAKKLEEVYQKGKSQFCFLWWC